jgi:hypothetical protein
MDTGLGLYLQIERADLNTIERADLNGNRCLMILESPLLQGIRRTVSICTFTSFTSLIPNCPAPVDKLVLSPIIQSLFSTYDCSKSILNTNVILCFVTMS